MLSDMVNKFLKKTTQHTVEISKDMDILQQWLKIVSAVKLQQFVNWFHHSPWHPPPLPSLFPSLSVSFPISSVTQPPLLFKLIRGSVTLPGILNYFSESDDRSRLTLLSTLACLLSEMQSWSQSTINWVSHTNSLMDNSSSVLWSELESFPNLALVQS